MGVPLLRAPLADQQSVCAAATRGRVRRVRRQLLAVLLLRREVRWELGREVGWEASSNLCTSQSCAGLPLLKDSDRWFFFAFIFSLYTLGALFNGRAHEL